MFSPSLKPSSGKECSSLQSAFLWPAHHLAYCSSWKSHISGSSHLAALTKLCLNKNSSDSAMQPQHSCFDTLYMVSLSGLFCWVNWGIEELDLGLIERVLTLLVKVTRIMSKKRTKWAFILALGLVCGTKFWAMYLNLYMWTWFKNMWLEFSYGVVGELGHLRFRSVRKNRQLISVCLIF